MLRHHAATVPIIVELSVLFPVSSGEMVGRSSSTVGSSEDVDADVGDVPDKCAETSVENDSTATGKAAGIAGSSWPAGDMGATEGALRAVAWASETLGVDEVRGAESSSPSSSSSASLD